MSHTARLIAITKPIVEDLKDMTAEDLVVYMARVSSPKNQYNTETAPKLLKFLLREGHVSPFQMVAVTLEINTTRAISHQLIRHRSLNVQEYSGRYAKMQDQMIPQECRLQDKTNRQKSLETDDPALHALWNEAQTKVWETAMQAYDAALAQGVAKEVARSLLPEGLVESRLYVTATLRDMMFYLKQRLANGTQKEHSLLAHAIAEALRPHFPNTFEAMEF